MSQPSSRRISPPHFRRAFAVPGTATQIGSTTANASTDITTKITNTVDVSCYQTVATSAVTKTTITTASTASFAHLSGSAEGNVITSTTATRPFIGGDNNSNINPNTNLATHISMTNVRTGLGGAGAGARSIPSSCPDSPIRRVSSSLKNSALGFASRFFNKCKAATFTVDGATYTIGKCTEKCLSCALCVPLVVFVSVIARVFT